jgi:hypothetical protein
MRTPLHVQPPSPDPPAHHLHHTTPTPRPPQGFAIIIEPYDERLPDIPDPVIQLSCLDASLAMRPVFSKYQ